MRTMAADYLTVRAQYAGSMLQEELGHWWRLQSGFGCKWRKGVACLPGNVPGARVRLSHGTALTLQIPGEHFRQLPGSVPEIVEAFTRVAIAASVVRIDWAVEVPLAPPLVAVGRDASEAQQVHSHALAVARRVDPQPRSGWTERQIGSETGHTCYFGIRGRDPASAREKDWFIRAYTVRERNVIRVEVERKKFAGLEVSHVYAMTLRECQRALAADDVAAAMLYKAPVATVRTPPLRLVKQLRSCLEGLWRRASVERGLLGGDMPEPVRDAVNVIEHHVKAEFCALRPKPPGYAPRVVPCEHVSVSSVTRRCTSCGILIDPTVL